MNSYRSPWINPTAPLPCENPMTIGIELQTVQTTTFSNELKLTREECAEVTLEPNGYVWLTLVKHAQPKVILGQVPTRCHSHQGIRHLRRHPIRSRPE